MRNFFEGLKVLDLSSVLAGPLTASFFAETGAEVTKIENKLTGGDVTRQWKLNSEDPDNPYSAYYSAANFGKKVLLLDLTSAEDRAIAEQLISESDIIISNFQKKTAEKLRLTPDLIFKCYPKVIFSQLSAYEYDDPRPGYDLVMQAETGYISMNGTTDGTLCKMPVAMIDILAAHQMKEAILIALIHRMQTGQGSILHISLYKSALSGLANQASNYLMCNHIPGPMGTLHPNIAPYGDLFYSSESIAFMLAIGSDAQFEKLWKTLIKAVENYHTFDTNIKRLENRSRLQELLQSNFSYVPFYTLESLLSENNIPYCRIADLSKVFDKPESESMINVELKDHNLRLKSVSAIAFDIKTHS
jgi:crotonobetainyl-CoA:carnitine CoA-transferase CaiB-like acyl-CoA transferase